MTRKSLFLALFPFLLWVSCDKKESQVEESTEHLDNLYGKSDSELNDVGNLETSQEDPIDQTTGVFTVADKTLELKACTEAQFNDVCLPKLRYLQSPICKNINDFEKCCMAFESQNIDKTNAPVKRDGDKLVIKLKNGKNKTLTNKVPKPDDGAEEYLAFVFSDFFPSLNVVAIDLFYYEGGETLLVDLENGEETLVVGDVNLSPDGKKLVAFSCDIMSGFRDNGIQLVERNDANGKLQISLSIDISKFGPENVCWLDNQTLIIKQLSVNENGDPVYTYATMRDLYAL